MQMASEGKTRVERHVTTLGRAARRRTLSVFESNLWRFHWVEILRRLPATHPNLCRLRAVEQLHFAIKTGSEAVAKKDNVPYEPGLPKEERG